MLGLIGLGLADLETTDNKTRRNTVALGQAWKRPRANGLVHLMGQVACWLERLINCQDQVLMGTEPDQEQ